MVEKFGYSASQVTLLVLINYAFNWVFAERIGQLIGRFGERRALTFEYIGLYNACESAVERPKVKADDFHGKTAHLVHREEEPSVHYLLYQCLPLH